MAQFADPQLRERFRLVALDLRGHGESQGAFGAIDQEGNPLAALAVAQYNDGNVETTSRSWAYDLDATIEALHLDHPVLIGWSADAWAVQSYFFAHGGLGTIGKAVLYASVPALLPPGTENGGTHLSVRPETIDGLLRTYPINPTVEPPSPNDDRTVAIGLMDFVNLCFADETDRAVSSASIQGTLAFNLLTPPSIPERWLRLEVRTACLPPVLPMPIIAVSVEREQGSTQNRRTWSGTIFKAMMMQSTSRATKSKKTLGKMRIERI